MHENALFCSYIFIQGNALLLTRLAPYALGYWDPVLILPVVKQNLWIFAGAETTLVFLKSSSRFP